VRACVNFNFFSLLCGRPIFAFLVVIIIHLLLISLKSNVPAIQHRSSRLYFFLYCLFLPAYFLVASAIQHIRDIYFYSYKIIIYIWRVLVDGIYLHIDFMCDSFLIDEDACIRDFFNNLIEWCWHLLKRKISARSLETATQIRTTVGTVMTTINNLQYGTCACVKKNCFGVGQFLPLGRDNYPSPHQFKI